MSLSGTITMVGAVWGRERRAASCGLSETQNALPEATATDSKKRRTSISDPRRCVTDVLQRWWCRRGGWFSQVWRSPLTPREEENYKQDRFVRQHLRTRRHLSGSYLPFFRESRPCNIKLQQFTSRQALFVFVVHTMNAMSGAMQSSRG